MKSATFLAFLPLALTMGAARAAEPPALADLGWKGVAWQNLNPGAGGNIQSLALDPNVAGRLFLNSDMEGNYRSDDYGQTWRYIGRDLSYSYVNALTVEPGNSGRVYSGTRGSLELSDDGGLSWKRVMGINDSIGQIAVHPRLPGRVFALPGERYRWSKAEDGGRGPVGKRDFYLSNDRGATWKTIAYAEGDGERRDILSFDFDPDNPSICYLGALTGVFRSRDGGQNWSQISAPPSVGDCLGASLAPDGKTLFAVYRVGIDGAKPVVTKGLGGLSVQGTAHLFSTPVDRIEWTNLSQGAPGFEIKNDKDATMYWRPRAVAAPGGATDVLVGTYRPQWGLWRVRVAPDARSAQWKRVLWYDSGKIYPDYTKTPFPVGWEHWGVTAEDYHVAPASWGRPLLFANAGQTVFVTDLSKPDFENSWQPRYTWKVSELKGVLEGKPQTVSTWRTRGTQSTFTFDGDGWKNYFAQSMADNSLMESWDGGYSWSEDAKPGGFLSSRSNAVAILRGLNPPLVVAHIANGWGADNRKLSNTLYVKRLDTLSPRDEWVAVAGGPDRLAGMWRDEYTRIAVDPKNPRRVAVGLRFNGIFLIDDVEALYNAAKAGKPLPPVGSATKLELPPRPEGVATTGTGLAFDPNDSDVLWASDSAGLWRGQKQGAKWNWKRVREGGNLDWAIWNSGGQTGLAIQERTVNHDQILVSRDGGQGWKKWLDFSMVKGLRPSPAWMSDDMAMSVGGLTSDGQHLYFTYQSALGEGIRPLGIFRADLSGDGTGRVEDFTADLPFAYPVRTRIIDNAGQKQLVFASRGNGLWRRDLE